MKHVNTRNFTVNDLLPFWGSICLISFIKNMLTGGEFCFVFIFSNETFHAVFGHSHHIIALNDGFGLGQLTEGRLESKNKFLKRYKERLSRKFDQNTCCTDIMNRLYLDASPILRAYKPPPSRSLLKKNYVPTNDDLFVQQFLIPDVEEN